MTTPAPLPNRNDEDFVSKNAEIPQEDLARFEMLMEQEFGIAPSDDVPPPAPEGQPESKPVEAEVTPSSGPAASPAVPRDSELEALKAEIAALKAQMVAPKPTETVQEPEPQYDGPDEFIEKLNTKGAAAVAELVQGEVQRALQNVMRKEQEIRRTLGDAAPLLSTDQDFTREVQGVIQEFQQRDPSLVSPTPRDLAMAAEIVKARRASAGVQQQAVTERQQKQQAQLQSMAPGITQAESTLSLDPFTRTMLEEFGVETNEYSLALQGKADRISKPGPKGPR